MPHSLKQSSSEPEAGKHPSSKSAGDQIRPGVADQRPKFPWRTALILAAVLLVLTAAVWLFGADRRGSLGQWLPLKKAVSTTELTEAGPDSILMFSQVGDLRQIMVLRSGQASWQLVSQDDSTAQNPSLSPDGNLVAYTSQRNGGEVVVVSLVDSQHAEVNSSTILKEGERENLRRLGLCEWSPVAWSPDNGRIAFFSCGTRPTRSILGVADLRTTPPDLTFVSQSEAENDKQRDVLWLNATQIVASSPITDSGTLDVSIDTYDVP